MRSILFPLPGIRVGPSRGLFGFLTAIPRAVLFFGRRFVMQALFFLMPAGLYRQLAYRGLPFSSLGKMLALFMAGTLFFAPSTLATALPGWNGPLGYTALFFSVFALFATFYRFFRECLTIGLWIFASWTIGSAMYAGPQKGGVPVARSPLAGIEIPSFFGSSAPTKGRPEVYASARSTGESWVDQLNPLPAMQTAFNDFTGGITNSLTKSVNDAVRDVRGSVGEVAGGFLPASFGDDLGIGVSRSGNIYGRGSFDLGFGNSNGSLPESAYFRRPSSGNMYPIVTGGRGDIDSLISRLREGLHGVF